MKPLEVDAHTHTLMSGHAYGTLTEMARAAAEKGLKVLGITEHTRMLPGTLCGDLYFSNLKVVPREMFGLRLLLGAELNIIDYEGHMDLPERLYSSLDLRIASLHDNCYTYGTRAQNTSALLGAMSTGEIDIIGHPDDSRHPLDYEAVVQCAIRHNVLLEINNNSLRSGRKQGVFENDRTILRLCRKHDYPVACDSDAHYMSDIGNTDHAEKVFAAERFPDELILNTSAERFLAFLQARRIKS